MRVSANEVTNHYSLITITMALLGTDVLGEYRARRHTLSARQGAVLLVIFPIFIFLCFYTLNLGMHSNRRIRAAGTNTAEIIRADIIDRNGEILAKNIYSADLVMNAKQIKDGDKAAAFVNSIFPDISVNEVLEKIESGGGYIELKKNIGREMAGIVRAEKIEGLIAVSKQIREYPKHNSMSHIVGFVNRDGDGIEGLELLGDTRLKTVSEPLMLSIDARIQSVMWAELNAAMTEYKAKAAMGILMNARTGEILSATVLPDFDPRNVAESQPANRRFRITRDNFEMGSIFKIFNTALALENGIKMDKTFNVLDPFLVDGRKVEEARGFRVPAKNLNIAQILQYSSNSGSAQIALSLPETTQLDFFRELYFDRTLTTNFGKTERPLFPKSDTKTDRSRWAFGHGIAVTPIHAFLAANAVVNDGKFIMPTIYRRDFVPNTRQVVSEATSRHVRQIMLKVMDTSGRAAAMQIQGINIGGKTSTAQKVVNGKYSDTKNVTAFFATFPIEAPKWSMLIILDEPQGGLRTSAHNAVPVAGKIMNAIIPLL